MAFGKKKGNSGQELSEVALRHGIRVSNPYGCYPEDVDRALLKYEELVNNLQAETQRLDAELRKTQEDKKAADAELQRLKLDMSLLEVPDTSAETDMAMLGRLNNVNENVGTIEPEVPEITESRIPIDIIENKPDNSEIKSTIDIIENKPETTDGLMFDNLVTPDTRKSGNSNKDPVNNVSSLYNEQGQLEIL